MADKWRWGSSGVLYVVSTKNMAYMARDVGAEKFSEFKVGRSTELENGMLRILEEREQSLYAKSLYQSIERAIGGGQSGRTYMVGHVARDSGC